MRFADLFIHPELDEAWCVRETLTGPAPTDVRRDIVAVPLDGSAAGDPARIRVLAASHHFLCCPRLSPDGERLSWIGWDHPSMPWDETVLCVAEVTAGEAGQAKVVAGGAGEAIVQAEWAGPRTLVYLNDPDGWWNLYRLELTGGTAGAAVPAGGGVRRGDVAARPALVRAAGRRDDRGDPRPRHAAGCPSSDTGRRAARRPARRTPSGPPAWPRPAPRSPGWPAEPAAALRDRRSASPGRPRHAASCPAVRRSRWTRPTCPQPQARTFRAADGRDIYASVYPPRNPSFTGPDGEPPPYVVLRARRADQPRRPWCTTWRSAYFTSRGIGVVEVNYGGSTGHGRAYRERLVRNWGVVDPADCAEVALALAAEGTADAGRLAIRGGSAGGWTTACSLDIGRACLPVRDHLLPDPGPGWLADRGDA